MKVLTPKEAADLLGVSVRSLAVWRSNKKHDIPYFKIGARVKYDYDALIEYITEQKKENK